MSYGVTLLFSDFANTTLAGSINTTATSLNVASGAGVLFPTPSAGQGFVIIIQDAATGLLKEIMLCTARSSDTLTVVRGQEGTTGLNWNAGDVIWHGITSGQMAQMVQLGTGGSNTPLSLSGTQSLSQAVRTTLLLTGSIGFGTISSGVITFTQGGIYIFNGYMNTTITITAAESIFANPFLEYNSNQVAVASATAYLTGAGPVVSAGSLSFSANISVGDTLYLGGYAGTLSGSGASSIIVNTASLYITKIT